MNEAYCLINLNSTNQPAPCCIFAPLSNKFSENVYDAWGYGGIAFLAIPPAMTLVMLAIFVEEVHYILLKGDSKELINALCWLLGTHPAIMIIGTIAIFVPRAVIYLAFLYGIFVAFAIYKYYHLIIVFAGGTQSFIEKSCEKLVGLNQFPCCCIVCLPKVYNSARITQAAKWLIQQNIILTPFYGALGVLLKADGKLYSLTGTSASLYLSIFNALATLMCMYGFKLLSELAQKIDGMEEVHAIVGKTRCMQLTMFVTGFEGMIFNALAQLGLFPCKPPLNFSSRRQVIFNYAVVLQAFFLGLMARFYYRRHTDIQRQAILRDDMVPDDNNSQTVFTVVDAYQHRSYEATVKANNLVPVAVSKDYPDDASSTSA